MIGKRLKSITSLIANGNIHLILSDQLLTEIKLVTSRPKLQKYFPQNAVVELLDLLDTIGTRYNATPTHTLERDLKDSFLLDLIDASNAHYLITGDNDLLELGKFKTAKIISPKEFEVVLEIS